MNDNPSEQGSLVFFKKINEFKDTLALNMPYSNSCERKRCYHLYVVF